MRASKFFFIPVFFSLSILIFAEAEITLTFGGDIMSHSVNLLPGDFRTPYIGIRGLLESDDLSFANLEFTIDDMEPMRGYPRFNVHREYVEAAIDSGIEVFSLANNHVNDLGVSGIFQTLRAVRDLKTEYGERVHFSGLRGNVRRGFRVESINIKGFEVGFIAVTQFLNRLEESPYVFKADYERKAERKALLEFVRRTSGGYDIFILSYHGGVEYSRVPDPKKVAFFHEAVEAGADVVYSHHPHVNQGYEIVRRRGLRKLIIFSAGNLLSGMTGNGGRYDGALFRVVFSVGHRLGGSATLESLRVIPVASRKRRDGLVVVTLTEDAGKIKEYHEVEGK